MVYASFAFGRSMSSSSHIDLGNVHCYGAGFAAPARGISQTTVRGPFSIPTAKQSDT